MAYESHRNVLMGGAVPPEPSRTQVADPGRSAEVVSLIASGRPMVALLASEYAAAFHPLTTEQLGQQLSACGFVGMETTVLGEELVAGQYERCGSRRDHTFPVLRSTCFAAVRHVRERHPELVGALAPIVPPYIAQARLIRALYPADVAIVYASPCNVRKEEAREPGLAGAVDTVIGLDEFRSLLPKLKTRREPPPLRRVQPPKQLSLTDGFPRKTLAGSVGTGQVVTARGAAEMDRLLGSIVRGESAPRMVDLLMCDGCLDGPCVNRDLTLAEKREAVIAERARQLVPPVESRDLLAALPNVDLVRSFRVAPLVESEAAIEPQRAAGAASVLSERLDSEVYRARRYSSEVSLMLLGYAANGGAPALDGLRDSDVVCPVAPGLVALIMPGISKTAAWAVAERMIAAQGGPDGSGPSQQGFSVSVCDSAGGRHDAEAMLRCAHEALAKSARAGDGRVELAAG